MYGRLRLELARWSVREWSMTAMAFVVLCAGLLIGSHVFAGNATVEVMRVRFGGDAQRTRVVLDVGAQVRGAVIETGQQGRVVLTLAGVAPRRGLSGSGSGLVRGFRVGASGPASRIELELSNAAEIERRFLLPPGDGVPNYRYVIDLRSTGPRPTTTNPSPSRPSERRAEKPLVVIDAGHGGHDPGASGANQRESALTLAAAQALKAELDASGRYRTLLTRSNDSYVDLYQRVRIARNAGADLFISLHADAGADPATRGASVYTLSEQGANRAVREVTRGDNWHRDLHLPGRDPSVDRILLDMTQRATQNRSAQFARVLLARIEASDHPLLRRSHRDAGLAVLLAPDVPAVLLEMGFITNPDDERALSDASRRRRLMRAVAESIDRYFDRPSLPMQMASADMADGGL